MIKKIITVLFALVLMVPVTVHAETYPKEDLDWKVNFDGSTLTSSRTEAEVAESLKGMEPGDEAVLELTLTNNSSKETTWYLSNEVIQSFEDTVEATGGLYTYILSYTDPDGKETVFYSSDKVGGTKPEDAGPDYEEGLHQATDALKELFRLGDIGAGKSGYLTLTIGLDGETLPNSYQSALADVKLDIAVEFTPEGSDDSEIHHLVPDTGVAGFRGAQLVNIYSVSSLILLIILVLTGSYLYNRRKGDAK